MRAAQFCFGQPEDRLVLINDRAFGQPKVGPIGISAEGNLTRLNLRQAFSGINNCNVFRRLIFKNPKFGRAIFGDSAITVEMIGGEVEPKRDGRPESFDCFQLKRTHFDCEHVELVFFQGDF